MTLADVFRATADEMERRAEVAAVPGSTDREAEVLAYNVAAEGWHIAAEALEAKT